VKKIDTPLTRLQAKYDARLAEMEQELEAMRLEKATVHGINELLKFELRSIESLLNTMQKGMDELRDHIRTLKTNLP
jgi:chromosome segregation ATPase